MADELNPETSADPPVGAIMLTGYDDAIVGSADHGITYSSAKIINILCERDGMTRSEAREFFEQKILSGACIPEVATFAGGGPVFVS